MSIKIRKLTLSTHCTDGGGDRKPQKYLLKNRVDSLFCWHLHLRQAGRPVGRRATDAHEPRQVREEAAISDDVCVVVDPGRTIRLP